MADEIANLRRQLEEERGLREEAERRLRPNSLSNLLDGCHSLLSLAIRVETDATLTTQGDTADPVNRIYPRRIIPWHEFPELQEQIWDTINAEPTFTSQHLFASPHQLEYVHGTLRTINSEIALRHFERDTVENFVLAILDKIYENGSLRQQLHLDGKLVYESHVKMGDTSGDHFLEDAMQQDIRDHPDPGGRRRGGRRRGSGNASRPPPGRPRNRRADEFCVYVTADEQRRPIYAVEFKAPHKLTLPQLASGLHEMEIGRDVIDQDGDTFQYHSTRSVAAVITQLFSYMVNSGVKVGYISTGEAYVFLRIKDDDPSVAQYFLSVPNVDVTEEDEYRLHRTAVAQVLAFTLNALAVEIPSQAWHAAASTLPTWKVEYLNILQDIPESIRKDPPSSEYKPSAWKPVSRSPYMLRSSCRPRPDTPQRTSEDDSENDSGPPSPSPSGVSLSKQARADVRRAAGRRQGSGRGIRQTREAGSGSKDKHAARDYCTMKCIHSLVNGGALDSKCPNVQQHTRQYCLGRHSLNAQEFTRKLNTQLVRNREEGFEQLHIRGRTGFLLKASLLSYGYTVIIKATTAEHAPRLLRETNIYNRLRALQGHYIPVCVGNFQPRVPYFYHGRVMAHMMILSWSGIRVQNIITSENEQLLLQKRDYLVSVLQSHGVIHKDTALRNMLWNRELGNAIMIDLEDVSLQSKREPLDQTSGNTARGNPCPSDRKTLLTRHC